MSSRSAVLNTTCCSGRDGSSREPRDQIIGGIAKFADMQIVEGRIVIRAGADRRAAERDRQIEGMGAAADVVHLLPLDMHAADEHRFGPVEILGRGGADIFVDETDFPVGRQICRDDQKALRRHEGLDAVGQRIGVLECPEEDV